jgi:2-isopropylmalate synthase
VFDYDLEALLFFDQQKHEQAYYKLQYLHATSGQNIIPSATVTIMVGEEEVTEASTGNGPVDAAFNAIIKAIKGHDLDIVDFKLDSKGEGAGALAQVSVIVEYNGRRFNGIGLATDIVEAGVKSLIFVLNNTYLADQIDQQKQVKIAGV